MRGLYISAPSEVRVGAVVGQLAEQIEFCHFSHGPFVLVAKTTEFCSIEIAKLFQIRADCVGVVDDRLERLLRGSCAKYCVQICWLV